MEISQALLNAKSIDQVVELVNEGGTSLYDQNEIAAQYAWSSAEDADHGMSTENLIAHLDLLSDAGAKFDSGAAIEALNEMMTDKIIETTSHETYNAIWAQIDGEVYGISETLDPATLMDKDGIPMNRNGSTSENDKIVEKISALKK
jgi:hypothetical protein